MPLDAVVLHAVTLELSQKLTGGRIDKVQMPEKDALLLSVRGQGENLKLLISANVGTSRIHFTGAAYENPAELATHQQEYDYYPKAWASPYIDRRRKVGWDLYALLGLAKTDKAGMHAQHGRNYRFFDAPVGLIFSIDRVMQQGSWLDYGMFLQSIMVAARARGLHTCPQAAFTQFHRLIAEDLAFRPEQMLVCGMAMGYADPAAVENSLVTERAPVSEFATFLEA